jgi:hypothetical protein
VKTIILWREPSLSQLFNRLSLTKNMEGELVFAFCGFLFIKNVLKENPHRHKTEPVKAWPRVIHKSMVWGYEKK